ncbi:MmpS family transport accessory protein [Micromonospora sp. NPDC047738]|uniref:MmpS family transport accessory protein n=1 Tax=unclassified Micromonospora TaxID=2617518 RepID=UPI0033E7C7C6
MSEPTPTPQPSADGGHTDPTTPPAPAPWTPPDPLAGPQPWVPQAPWSPTPWSPGSTGTPGPTGGAGTAGGIGTPGNTGQPDATADPARTGPPGSADAPRPAVPPVTPVPPPAHPWPGYAAPGWPPAGYPPPYAYPGMPPTRTNGGKIAAIIVGVATVLVLLFCGCVGLGVLGNSFGDPVTSGEPYGDPGYGEPEEDATAGQPSPATTPSGGPGRFEVVYEVTGTEAVNVQFYDANGDFLQVDEVQSPWRLAFTANDRQRVQIVALPANRGGDPITCQITIDGKVVSRDSSSSGAIATCFGW